MKPPQRIKTPGTRAKLPVWHSLSLSGHFGVWVTVWVRPVDPHFDPHKIPRNRNKNSRNPAISGVLWSCWADSNCRPHPYQLIASPPNTVFYRFGGIFVPWQRGLWHFPIHCFRPLISPCGSQCGSQCRSNSKINTCTM